MGLLMLFFNRVIGGAAIDILAIYTDTHSFNLSAREIRSQDLSCFSVTLAQAKGFFTLNRVDFRDNLLKLSGIAQIDLMSFCWLHR